MLPLLAFQHDDNMNPPHPSVQSQISRTVQGQALPMSPSLRYLTSWSDHFSLKPARLKKRAWNTARNCIYIHTFTAYASSVCGNAVARHKFPSTAPSVDTMAKSKQKRQWGTVRYSTGQLFEPLKNHPEGITVLLSSNNLIQYFKQSNSLATGVIVSLLNFLRPPQTIITTYQQ